MKRALTLLTLSVLLSACTQMDFDAAPSDQTVALGTKLTTSASQSFDGSWQVEMDDVPAWLTVTPSAGNGPVALTISAQRRKATPLTADVPQLSAVLTVNWKGRDGKTTGTAKWTVTADQYRLTGRVLDSAGLSSARVQGLDVLPGSRLFSPPQGPQAGARGIIVTYRNAEVRDAVLSGRQPDSLQAQGSGTVGMGEASAARLRQLGLGATQLHPLGAKSLRLDTPASATTLERLRADPNVQSAVANRVLHALGTLATPVVPADQYSPLQWSYRLLGYGAVWRDMEAGGYQKPVTVAVLDSGVRFGHPDLAGQLYDPTQGALDLVDEDNDPTDPGLPTSNGGRESHGTHVTGIIVANWGSFASAPCAGCSESGVVGATYRAPVKVLPIRILGPEGTDVATATTAIRYAAGLPVTVGGQTYTNPHPAQVINLSLGGGGMTAEEVAPMCEALAQARSKGILAFAAAGNDGGSTPYYPAACPAAVAVGSVTLSGGNAPQHAWYSNRYPKVELSAPGGAGRTGTTFNGGTLNGEAFPDEIFSTGWDYGKDQPAYLTSAGTSQAAPQASALAALLLSKGLTSGAEDTLTRLKDTATDLGAPGRDPLFGVGLINAAAALNAPAVADGLGLRLQDAQGQVYQPALDAQGSFTAYLPEGTYQATGGRDWNGNGIYGEAGEPHQTKAATLGPSVPSAEVGELKPQ